MTDLPPNEDDAVSSTETAMTSTHHITVNGRNGEQSAPMKKIDMCEEGNAFKVIVYGCKERAEVDPIMASAFHRFQFTIVLLVFQIIFFILFGLFGRYTPNALPGGSASTNFVNSNYPMFQDVHVMIFVGFGFLMVFLRRYGFSAISINMLLSCFVIQWSMIVRGFWSKEFETSGKFTISIAELTTADFAAAVILITMGALLGKLSPTQYIIMSFIEVPIALTIEHVVVHYLEANDIGGSMVVHAFGAYFGLALSFVIYKKKMLRHENEGSNYNSDIFSMIGALFLWIFWPSFNATVARPEDARQRATLNTYLSLCACTVVTFILSQLVDYEHNMRFSMTHIANSTLAGGVAIGTTANVVLEPLHALLVGSGAAVISVFGYAYLTPFLARKLRIHDTCGVNNLHGMPGIYAGLLAFIFAIAYDPSQYGLSLATIYPAIKTTSNPEGREMIIQASYQLAALAVVLASAIVSGAITGIILKLKIWNQVRDKEFYADGDYFEVPEDFDFTTRITSKIDHIELAEHTPLTSKDNH